MICPTSTPGFPNILGIPMACATNVPIEDPYMFTPPLAFFVADWGTIIFLLAFSGMYRILGGEGARRQIWLLWLFWFANVVYGPYGLPFIVQLLGIGVCFWIGGMADLARSGCYGSIVNRFDRLGDKVKGL